MSGAAGIAAAKNRRSKTEPNQKQLPPPITCGKNGAPPSQKSVNTPVNKSASVSNTNTLVDPVSLQILGPMPPVEILRVHEQRLNRLDERLSTQPNSCESTNYSEMDDCFSRVDTLESKISMLEEVIMTLQNKLTIAQNFAMETNMSMSALAKKLEQAQQCQNQAQQTNIISLVDITQSLEDSEPITSGETSPITLEIIS